MMMIYPLEFCHCTILNLLLLVSGVSWCDSVNGSLACWCDSVNSCHWRVGVTV